MCFHRLWKRRGLGLPIKNNQLNKEELLSEIEQAKNEWVNIQQQFHYVSEPDVVEYIIYYIQASERRYMYLLRKYKELYGEVNLSPEKVPV